MIEQEDDPDLDDDQFIFNYQFKCFRKSREGILGRVKVTELSYIQGPKSSKEDLFVRDVVPTRTERPSVREPGTDGNHAPVSQVCNNSLSDSSQ